MATMKEKKAALTAKIVKARAHYQATQRMVGLEVSKKNPDLEWWQKAQEVDNDPRVQVANATLLALCEAANIMGAPIE